MQDCCRRLSSLLLLLLQLPLSDLINHIIHLELHRQVLMSAGYTEQTPCHADAPPPLRCSWMRRCYSATSLPAFRR